jgi:hypothetical protein
MARSEGCFLRTLGVRMGNSPNEPGAPRPRSEHVIKKWRFRVPVVGRRLMLPSEGLGRTGRAAIHGGPVLPRRRRFGVVTALGGLEARLSSRHRR